MFERKERIESLVLPVQIGFLIEFNICSSGSSSITSFPFWTRKSTNLSHTKYEFYLQEMISRTGASTTGLYVTNMALSPSMWSVLTACRTRRALPRRPRPHPIPHPALQPHRPCLTPILPPRRRTRRLITLRPLIEHRPPIRAHVHGDQVNRLREILHPYLLPFPAFVIINPNNQNLILLSRLLIQNRKIFPLQRHRPVRSAEHPPRAFLDRFTRERRDEIRRQERGFGPARLSVGVGAFLRCRVVGVEGVDDPEEPGGLEVSVEGAG